MKFDHIDKNTPVCILKNMVQDGNQKALDRLCELAVIGYEETRVKPARTVNLKLATEITDIAVKLLLSGCSARDIVSRTHEQLQSNENFAGTSRRTVSRYLKGKGRITRLIQISIKKKIADSFK